MHLTGKAGFSVIEIIVVALVIGIVALIGITQIRSLSPAQTLENGSNDLRSALVLARSYTQTGHVCCGSQLPNGYGIVFTIDGAPNREASLYADLDSPNSYVAGGSDVVLSTVTLPDGVNFTQCQDSTATVTSGTCDILFQGSGLANLYSNADVETSAITITLEHTSAALSDEVTVNAFGVIE